MKHPYAIDGSKYCEDCAVVELHPKGYSTGAAKEKGEKQQDLPQTIRGYKLVEKLGAGAFGMVGRYTKKDKTFAIKVLTDSSSNVLESKKNLELDSHNMEKCGFSQNFVLKSKVEGNLIISDAF